MIVARCFVLAVLVSASTLQGDVLYSVQALGTLGGSQSGGYGLSDNGQIAGYSTTSDGSVHAFLHNTGSMKDLGTFGGAISEGALKKSILQAQRG